MNQPAYNIRAIRKLLTTAFSTDESLRQFCMDFPELRPVTERFSSGMGKDQMIQRLIEFCESKVLTLRLLELVEEDNPDAYAQFKAEVFGKTPAKPSLPPVDPNSVINETEFLQKMITEKTRYLQTLQLQAARFGISVPVHIAIEIEDLEKEIARLRQQLNASG